MRNALGCRQGTRPTVVSDEELVARAQAGDASAFEELVRQHGRRLYHVTLRLCHGYAQDAEETSQNALLKAYQHLADFRGESQFSTWLTRIAINECLMCWRRKKPEHEWVSLDEEISEDVNRAALVGDGSDDPEEQYAWREFEAILARCLDRLPEPSRAVFVLRDLEKLSGQEVAGRLGLSIPAVKSRLHRARFHLQACLREHFCRQGQCYWPSSGSRVRMPLLRKINCRGSEKPCSLSR